MKATSILTANLLDIIFENRNKDYGAYELRKYYAERLYRSLGITFLFISLLSVYGLLQKPPVVSKDREIITSPGQIFQPPQVKKVPKAPERPRQPVTAKIANASLFTSIIKLVDSTDESTKLPKNLDSSSISNINSETPGNHKSIVYTVGGAVPPGNGPAGPAKPSIDKETPFGRVDIMPEFPGGVKELMRFLQKNLNNPRDLEEGETVSVKIKFVVGYDGVLKGFETVEDGGKAFNNEVIRVLKKMPVWTPGKAAGENISVYYTIPVKFVPAE